MHFETIHPFLDGNGRIGRLLIVLMLINSEILKLPIIYPSYYFKKHHAEYYEKLDKVRTEGDFEGWIVFYLKAIKASALDAHLRAKDIEALDIKIKNIVDHAPEFSRLRDSAKLILDVLFINPIISISDMSSKLDKNYNTISNIFRLFASHKFVEQTSSGDRNRLYSFTPYLILLEKEYNNS